MSTPDLPAPGSTERTRVRRIPEKAVTDRSVLHTVLDAGLVAHVAVVDDGQPYVVPVAYARDGERVLFHGSTGSRLFRALAEGSPTCFTVTLLDGLVLARSAFESSMHYRGAMVLGTCTVLEGDDKDDALRIISDHLLPGRWDDIREPSKKELAATLMLALPLDEVSVKISASDPDDDPQDVDRPVWGGVVPIREVFGEPRPDERGAAYPVPEYVKAWTR
ncbi:pyridoxamine 5'-phosphate oxidase family protein [Longivirga aurantiaca]|uniref:Pyridoxamine 5'-phosphate oxidase family protein n=1 Tax=Longivirga aurantiaca TaxID=1837743 RepID=A0ABW1T042_9ACTN